jgi:hypothetical protein
MPQDWSIDVAIAPDGALQRIAAAMNLPKRRAFGVLKTTNEFVGVVGVDTFEIWERQQRAVHALGRINGRRGGTRIEVRFILPLRTRVLIALFFFLYAVVASGLALAGGVPAASAEKLVAAVAGAAVLVVFFSTSAWRQRSDLRTFIERIFADLSRI